MLFCAILGGIACCLFSVIYATNLFIKLVAGMFLIAWVFILYLINNNRNNGAT